MFNQITTHFQLKVLSRYSAESIYMLCNFLYKIHGLQFVIQGNLVYAYYGRDEDYQKLEKLGINVTGNIVLLRYGAIFRGSKV